jgi:SAM-dependent methyltransferase
MEKHEAIYQGLKKAGHGGWGGQKYQDRMDGLDINLSKLLEETQLTSGYVLELGSGAGDVSIWFAKKGFTATGVEISETAVKWAEEKAGDLNTSFVHASVTEEHLLDGQLFDLVLDGNCLHCLFGDDRHRFYQNATRLLKDDGYLYIASVIGNYEGATATVGPIERCFLTEEALKVEVKSYGYNLIKEWVRPHAEYSHYIGIFKK